MVEKPSVSALQNFFRIENRLNIKVRRHFIQSRVEFLHLIVFCIRCCVRATNTSVSTVSTNIAFNALHALIFILTVSTKKIPYTIHNSIALIFCIDHLDMPFNVHTTDKSYSWEKKTMEPEKMVFRLTLLPFLLQEIG